MDGCESWIIKKSCSAKNWCFWTVVLEQTLENPLDCKIKPVNPKGNELWIFIGRTDAEAEVSIFWAPDVKDWLIGEDWCWERLKAGGEGDNWGWDGWMASLTQWTWVWASSRSLWGTGKPACCSPWGCKESDMTEWMNWLTVRVFKFKFYLKLNIFISNDMGFFFFWQFDHTTDFNRYKSKIPENRF